LKFYFQCGAGSWPYSNTSLDVSGSSLPTDSNTNVINQILLRPDSNKWIANNYGSIAPNCSSALANGTIDCTNGAWQIFYYQSDPIHLNGTPPSSGWTFSWTAPCCRPYASNLSNSSSAASTAYAKMYVNPINSNQCFDSSPHFIEPLSEPFHCNGELNVNYGAIDEDSDSLVYQFEQLNVNYATEYSFNNPLPDSNINNGNRVAYLNPNTGIIDAKVLNIGSYMISVRVDAWRNGSLMASVNRERLITLQNCPTLPNNNPNDLPIISLGASSNFHQLKIKAGDSIQLSLALSDTNTTVSTTGLQQVKLFPEAAMFASDFQDTLACPNPPCATLTNQTPQYDTIDFRYSLVGVGAVGTNFKWKTDCNHLTDSGKTKKYYFYLLGRDDHCPLPAVNHGVIEVEVEPLLVNGLQFLNGSLSSLDTVDQYQWYDCVNDSIIIGATSSSFTPIQNGDYAVILQNGNCRDTSNCYSVTTVGLDENHFKNSINFYPNPSNGLVNIEVAQKQMLLQVKVRNIHGQLVQEENYKNQNQLQLQLNGKAGIYFIELINAKGERANLKLVKR
jgi:hypothetical protein